MPSCKVDLIEHQLGSKETYKCEMAHIVPISGHGPRGDVYIDPTKINSYENLILICANCHVIIDKNSQTYTVEKLLAIKQEHENLVLKSVRAIPSTDFSELDNILKYLTSDTIQIRDSFELIPPNKKIQKNNLSHQIAQLIIHGMIGVAEVDKYLQSHPDINFGNRLQERFVQEYCNLYHDHGLTNDELFYRLWDFASMHSNKDHTKMAGLSILTYLFEKCDVFEK